MSASRCPGTAFIRPIRPYIVSRFEDITRAGCVVACPPISCSEATRMTMTLKETLKQLEALGNEKVRAQNRKHGAGDNQFGVLLGDIRKLAAKIKTNHEMAIALWETGNLDARLLAILLIEPKKLSTHRDGSDGSVRQLCAGGGLAQLLCRQETSRQGGSSPGLDGR